MWSHCGFLLLYLCWLSLFFFWHFALIVLGTSLTFHSYFTVLFYFCSFYSNQSKKDPLYPQTASHLHTIIAHIEVSCGKKRDENHFSWEWVQCCCFFTLLCLCFIHMPLFVDNVLCPITLSLSLHCLTLFQSAFTVAVSIFYVMWSCLCSSAHFRRPLSFFILQQKINDATATQTIMMA